MQWNINCRKVVLFVNSITFIVLILSVLALLDIYQRNEANLDNEWIVLQVSFIWFFTCKKLELINYLVKPDVNSMLFDSNNDKKKVIYKFKTDY